MAQYLISLTVTADGKLAVRELIQVAAAEKGVQNQTASAANATRAAQSDLERYMASLRKEVETLGMSRGQLRLYEAARMGATSADLRAIEVSNKLIEAHQRKAASINDGIGVMTRAAAGFVSIWTAINIGKHLAETSDNAVLLAARLKLVTDGMRDQARVQEELFRTAQGMQLPYFELAATYPRLVRAVREVGGSTGDALALQRMFAQAVRVSGTNTAEAAASALQFSQALASGRLSGDELRSILENNSRLAQALADGLGVTVGELRRLGEEGKLTAEKVIQALLSQKDVLEREAAGLPKTISGSWAQLTNEIDKTTTSSDSFNASAAAVVWTLQQMAAAVKVLRESGMLAFLIAPPVAIARQFGRSPGGAGAAAGATWDADDAELGASMAQAGKRGEGALRQFRELTKEAESAAGVYARYRAEIDKISDVWKSLAAAGELTAEREKELTAQAVGANLKRQVALDQLAKKGQSSLQSEVTVLKKRAELEQAYADSYYAELQDLTQRALAAEEFFHRAGLTGEIEYINEKARIQTQGARDRIAQLQGELAAEERLLRDMRSQRPVGPTEVRQHEADVVEQERKVEKARAQLAAATRKLGDIETDRGNNTALYEKKIIEAIIAAKRAREDYTRSLDDELEDMRLEVELIGQNEIAQRKANRERELTLRQREKELELERRIKDLRRGNADPRLIAEAEQELAEILAAFARLRKEAPKLIEEAFAKQVVADLARSIAEALVDGGEDAAGRIRKAVEDTFKKPIKMALQGFLQKGIESLLNSIPGFNMQMLQGPMGVAAGLGMFGGGLLGGAFGGGPRSGQVGSIAGGLLGGIGFALGGPIGAALGTLIGGVIGHFSDPEGPADRRARFGTAPGGNYDFGSVTSAFGTFGSFASQWFSESEMGEQMRGFMRGQARLENSLAAMMTRDERERARAALTGSREYSFGIEHDAIRGLGQITRDRLAAIVEAAMPGLGQLVQAFEGTGEEIVRMAQSLFGLRDSLLEIDAAIAQLTGSSVEAFRAQMDALDRQVGRARSALDTALETRDPEAIYASEQQLLTAVMNRYQAEIQMVEQLRDAIDQLREEAYQFAISIAQRINSVGGSRDVGAIALSRASDLRGGIGGDTNPAHQTRFLQQYVGSIDTWYQARRSEIERQMAAEQEALRAVAAAQQAAAQARIAQLQGELALAQQYQGIVDRTREMINDMRRSRSNPLPLPGRVALAQTDVRSLMEAYQAATGSSRIDLANRVLEAIQTYRALGQEALQRPSGEWDAIYNEIVRDLTLVQEDAKSYAERSVEIEQAILQVQNQAAAYQASIASAAAASNHYLDALNAEALGYYTWAEEEATRLYALQEQQQQDLLDAITGGMEPELYIAARAREQVDVLEDIRDIIRDFLRTVGTQQTSSTDGSGGAGDAFKPGGPSGQEKVNVVVVPVARDVTTADVIRALKAGGTEAKRILSTA